MRKLIFTIFFVLTGCSGGVYDVEVVHKEDSEYRPQPSSIPEAEPRDTSQETRSSERCNGKDDDGDGVVDELCACSYLGLPGKTCQSLRNLQGKCEKPEYFERVETTCDGLDNDCDGKIDEPKKCVHRKCLFDGDKCSVISIDENEEDLVVNLSCEDGQHILFIPNGWVRKKDNCWMVDCPGSSSIMKLCKSQ